MSYSQPSGKPLLWSPTASPWHQRGEAHWVSSCMEVGNWESFGAQNTGQQYETQGYKQCPLGSILLKVLAHNEEKACLQRR